MIILIYSKKLSNSAQTEEKQKNNHSWRSNYSIAMGVHL